MRFCRLFYSWYNMKHQEIFDKVICVRFRTDWCPKKFPWRTCVYVAGLQFVEPHGRNRYFFSAFLIDAVRLRPLFGCGLVRVPRINPMKPRFCCWEVSRGCTYLWTKFQAERQLPNSQLPKPMIVSEVRYNEVGAKAMKGSWLLI